MPKFSNKTREILNSAFGNPTVIFPTVKRLLKCYTAHKQQVLPITSTLHLLRAQIPGGVCYSTRAKGLLSTLNITCIPLSPSSGLIKNSMHALLMKRKMFFSTGNLHWNFIFCCPVWNYLVPVSSTDTCG